MNAKPIYYHSATYAREHNELEQYRDTTETCKICSRDIETICAARFDGMRLSKLSIIEALAVHDPALISLVLSATIIEKEYDGRFSRSNKEWAHTIKQFDRADSVYKPFIIRTHPAVLDGFISLFRKATAS